MFQPFPCDGKDHQTSDASGEYSHAEEYCGRARVRPPVVGVVTASSGSRSGSEPGLIECFVLCRER